MGQSYWRRSHRPGRPARVASRELGCHAQVRSSIQREPRRGIITACPLPPTNPQWVGRTLTYFWTLRGINSARNNSRSVIIVSLDSTSLVDVAQHGRPYFRLRSNSILTSRVSSPFPKNRRTANSFAPSAFITSSNLLSFSRRVAPATGMSSVRGTLLSSIAFPLTTSSGAEVTMAPVMYVFE